MAGLGDAAGAVGPTGPALSPRLVARWETRRHETIEAVRAGLRDGTLATPRAQLHAAESHPAAERLAVLLHKLAGTAAMFGEAGLGDCAAALERALALEQTGETCVALARELLALADRPAEAEWRKVNRAAG